MEEVGIENQDEMGPFPWQLFVSLALSLLIVAGGMLWTYGIWKQSNQKFHELAHVQETVDGLQSRLVVKEASIR